MGVPLALKWCSSSLPFAARSFPELTDMNLDWTLPQVVSRTYPTSENLIHCFELTKSFSSSPISTRHF